MVITGSVPSPPPSPKPPPAPHPYIPDIIASEIVPSPPTSPSTPPAPHPYIPEIIASAIVPSPPPSSSTTARQLFSADNVPSAIVPSPPTSPSTPPAPHPYIPEIIASAIVPSPPPSSSTTARQLFSADNVPSTLAGGDPTPYFESSTPVSTPTNGDDTNDKDDSDSDSDDNSSSSSTTTTNNNKDGMCEYELLRLERIRRNQERLQRLGLLEFNIQPPPKKKQKRAKKKVDTSASEPRRVQPSRNTKNKLTTLEGRTRRCQRPYDRDDGNHDTVTAAQSKVIPHQLRKRGAEEQEVIHEVIPHQLRKRGAEEQEVIHDHTTVTTTTDLKTTTDDADTAPDIVTSNDGHTTNTESVEVFTEHSLTLIKILDNGTELIGDVVQKFCKKRCSLIQYNDTNKTQELIPWGIKSSKVRYITDSTLSVEKGTRIDVNGACGEVVLNEQQNNLYLLKFYRRNATLVYDVFTYDEVIKGIAGIPNKKRGQDTTVDNNVKKKQRKIEFFTYDEVIKGNAGIASKKRGQDTTLDNNVRKKQRKIEFPVEEKEWKKMFDHLVIYKTKDANVQQPYKENKKKKRYNKHVSDISWEERRKQLENYKAAVGDTNVPHGYTSNKPLGSWVNNQRCQYKFLKQGKSSSMTWERFQSLQELDFQWEIEGVVSWEQRRKQLENYKDTVGHTNVPRVYEENEQLGLWVQTQRCQYRLLKQGKSSAMTEERIQSLNELEFNWELRVSWEERRKQLENYKDTVGDTNVPRGYKKNKQLGLWVNTQRTQYKLLKQGKSSSMTEERIRSLNELEFIWKQGIVSWEERRKQLENYKDTVGDTNVPRGYKKNKQLGTWVATQRRYYKLLKQGKSNLMTQERIQSLNELEFNW